MLQPIDLSPVSLLASELDRLPQRDDATKQLASTGLGNRGTTTTMTPDAAEIDNMGALDVLTTAGVHACTVDEVARRTGIAKTTIYRHCGGSDANSRCQPCGALHSSRTRLRKSQDRLECFVDAPHFFGRETTGAATKSLHINSTELFDQHACFVAMNNDPRAKGRSAGTSRRRDNKNDRPRKKLVRLNNYAETLTHLFVTNPLRNLETKNVTALHASTPSWQR